MPSDVCLYESRMALLTYDPLGKFRYEAYSHYILSSHNGYASVYYSVSTCLMEQHYNHTLLSMDQSSIRCTTHRYLWRRHGAILGQHSAIYGEIPIICRTERTAISCEYLTCCFQSLYEGTPLPGDFPCSRHYHYYSQNRRSIILRACSCTWSS